LITPSLTATTGAPWWEKMLIPRGVGEEAITSAAAPAELESPPRRSASRVERSSA
jgi:hypothetical protein